MNLSEIHDCEKCHGKIVGIEVDKLGRAFCGYCHQQVDYISYLIKEGQELKLEGLRLKEKSKELFNL